MKAVMLLLLVVVSLSMVSCWQPYQPDDYVTAPYMNGTIINSDGQLIDRVAVYIDYRISDTTQVAAPHPDKQTSHSDSTYCEMDYLRAFESETNNAYICWRTSREHGISYFKVFRSETNDFSTAEMINILNLKGHIYGSDYCDIDTLLVANTTYYYWIKAEPQAGASFLFGPDSLRVGTGIPPALPDCSGSFPIYPNAVISPDNNIFCWVQAGHTATLSIYKSVNEYSRTYNLTEGFHTLHWDLKTDNGDEALSGPYNQEMIAYDANHFLDACTENPIFVINPHSPPMMYSAHGKFTIKRPVYFGEMIYSRDKNGTPINSQYVSHTYNLRLVCPPYNDYNEVIQGTDEWGTTEEKTFIMQSGSTRLR